MRPAWRTVWRRICTNNAVVTAATAGGASNRFGSPQPANRTWVSTTSPVSTRTRPTATRTGRMRNPVYSNGTAHQAKLGASTTSTAQQATSRANHTVPRRPPGAPATYNSASRPDSANTQPDCGLPG